MAEFIRARSASTLAAPSTTVIAVLSVIHALLGGIMVAGLIITTQLQQLPAIRVCLGVTMDLLLTPTASQRQQPGDFQPPQAFHLPVSTINRTHPMVLTLAMRTFAVINIPVVINTSVEDILITVATKMFVGTNILAVTNTLPAGERFVATLHLVAVRHQTTLTV